MPTQYNSPIYKDSRPGVDAACVAVCRAAGALVYGKTVCLTLSFTCLSDVTTQHTTEFASTSTGPPACNAFDQRRSPGGSSSGSGAAVSDWQCHIAPGTQTGGDDTHDQVELVILIAR